MDAAESEIGTETVVDNLTEIHAESQLPTAHQSRHTKSGFLVDGPRLAGYIPTPPGKQPRSSYVWRDEVGVGLTHVKTGKRYWMCRACFEKPGSQSLYLKSDGSTTRAMDHLGDHKFGEGHYYKRDGTYAPPEKDSKKRTRDGDVQAAFQAQKRLKESTEVFDRIGWCKTFLEWKIDDDQSLRNTASKRLRRLLCYKNSTIENIVPRSHTTTRRWLMNLFGGSKPNIMRNLKRARSRLCVSFDGWKSDNELELLGVFAHYVNHEGKYVSVMLGLPNLYGSKEAQDTADAISKILTEFEIRDDVRYFQSDNVNINDKVCRLLAADLGLHPQKCRLRCSAHILNLVCKAILYGCDIDAIDQACEESEEDEDNDCEPDDLDDDEEVKQFERQAKVQEAVDSLVLWRKRGAVGKLHNIIVHARHSGSRREFFKDKQKETNPDMRILELILNGGIRWNSDHDMMERGVKLKGAIELYQAHYREVDDRPLAQEDCLTSEDWQDIKELCALLRPVKEASLGLQMDGTYIYGSLWQSLTTLNLLMTRLEEAKNEQSVLPNSHYKACVLLGWKKLDKYFALTDRSPAYIASIALHPHFKLRWFDDKWSGLRFDPVTKKRSRSTARFGYRKKKKSTQSQASQTPAIGELFTDRARRVVKELWLEYKERYGSEALPTARLTSSTSRDPTGYEEGIWMTEDAVIDEYDKYLAAPAAPPKTDALSWWNAHAFEYPILSKLAYDLIACPASSTAAERCFSEAGHVLNEEAWHTRSDLAEANQCLKNWLKYDLIADGVEVWFDEESGVVGDDEH